MVLTSTKRHRNASGIENGRPSSSKVSPRKVTSSRTSVKAEVIESPAILHAAATSTTSVAAATAVAAAPRTRKLALAAEAARRAQRKRLFPHRAIVANTNASKLPVDFKVLHDNVKMEDNEVESTLETLHGQSGTVGETSTERLGYTRRVDLPRIMVRPPVKAIDPEKLVDLDHNLEDIDINFIRDGLLAVSPDWYHSASTSVPIVPKNSTNISRTYRVRCPANVAQHPTHVLVVFDPNAHKAPADDGSVVHDKMLMPSHNMILAAHCAELPSLESDSADLELDDDNTVELPTFPLPVPYPRMFPHLHAYLYLKHPAILACGMLPRELISPWVNLFHPCASDEELERRQSQLEDVIRLIARQMAQTYTAYSLMTYVRDVNGMRLDVSTLGVHDEGVWFAIDTCWKILLHAFALSGGAKL